jgi:hypothetical protein
MWQGIPANFSDRIHAQVGNISALATTQTAALKTCASTIKYQYHTMPAINSGEKAKKRQVFELWFTE